jgi:PAS domain S-box-containing protein
MTEEISVLHVDDDPDFADISADFLEREDGRLTVETATDAGEALGRLEGETFDCIVSDHDMPGKDGIAFLEAVREDRPDLPFVLFTGKGSEEIASEAVSAGVSDYLQKGGPDQFAVLANRITNLVEKSQAERARERYRVLVEEATDVILVVGPDATIQYATPSAESILGRAPAELVGTSGFEPIHPEDRDRVVAIFADLADNHGERRTAEFRYERPDGSWIWVEARGRNLRESPVVDGIVVYTRDVTERKRREQELGRYETFVETVAGGVFVQDEDANYAYVNSYIEDETGYDREEIVGNDPSMFMPESDIQEVSAAIGEMLDGSRETVQFETDITTKGGDTVPVEGQLALLPSDGGFEGTVGMIRNITDRKERERELRRQKERLEKFTSVVSHDLRSPLTVAEGRLEMAMEECDSDHLDAVSRTHSRMRVLIEDLLTLAREGEQATDTVPVALAETAEQCWEHVDTADATPVVETGHTVRADRGRLQQLLENLIRNSVEHGSTTAGSRAAEVATEHGDTAVTVEVGDLESGFYVADDGPGIPASEREQVFEPGYSTGDTGTGFGLGIVREVAEGHGWEVTVTDSDAGGARFEVTGVDVLDT